MTWPSVIWLGTVYRIFILNLSLLYLLLVTDSQYCVWFSWSGSVRCKVHLRYQTRSFCPLQTQLAGLQAPALAVATLVCVVTVHDIFSEIVWWISLLST